MNLTHTPVNQKYNKIFMKPSSFGFNGKENCEGE
jgi:hypothetical protein